MKSLLVMTLFIAAFLIQAQAKAASSEIPSYAAECKIAAVHKFRSIAQLNGLQLNENSIQVSNVDDRWYNPSKYVWFSAVVKRGDGVQERIEVLTQKNILSDGQCF